MAKPAITSVVRGIDICLTSVLTHKRATSDASTCQRAAQVLSLAVSALVLQCLSCTPWAQAGHRLGGLLQLGIAGPLSSSTLHWAATADVKQLHRLQLAEIASACLIWLASQWMGNDSIGSRPESLLTMSAVIATLIKLQAQLASAGTSTAQAAASEVLKPAAKPAAKKPTASPKKGPRRSASFAHPSMLVAANTPANPMPGIADVVHKAPWLTRVIQAIKAAHTIACCLVAAGLTSTHGIWTSQLTLTMCNAGLLQVMPQVVLLYCVFQQDAYCRSAATANQSAQGAKAKATAADKWTPSISRSESLSIAGSGDRIKTAAEGSSIVPSQSMDSKSKPSDSLSATSSAAAADKDVPLKKRVSIQVPTTLSSVFGTRTSTGSPSFSPRTSIANSATAKESEQAAVVNALRLQLDALQQSLLDIQEEQKQYEVEWSSILTPPTAVRRKSMAGRVSMGGTAIKKNIKEEAIASYKELMAWKTDTEPKLRQVLALAQELDHPVKGVLALSDTLIQGKHGDLSQGAKDQLAMARSCAHHSMNMISMYQSVLEAMNRRNRGRGASMQLDPCQLSKEVDKALDRLTPMAGKRLTLSSNVAKQHAALADPRLLYQAVHVLLANAIKYTRTGSVEVYSELSADQEHVLLCVKDQGPGFSPEQIQQYSLDDSRVLPGLDGKRLGLGLLMVQHIMHTLCGEVGISNNRSTDSGSAADADPTPTGATVCLKLRNISMMPSDSLAGMVTGSQAGSQGGSSQHGSSSVHGIRGEEDAPPSGAQAAVPRKRRLLSSNPPGARTAPMREKPAPAAPDNTPVSVADAIAMAAKHMVEPESNAQAGAGSGFAVDEGEDSGMLSGMLIKGAATGTGTQDTHTILIVEDDPNNLTLLEEMISNSGYSCLTANDGATAIMTFLSAGPCIQLVLMEADLPDMKGMDVCDKMRSLCPGRPPPIVILAGLSEKGDMVEGLKRGASDWITKPFKPSELMARLATQLRMHHGDWQQLQDAAERNMLLLNQVLPPHVLDSLKEGNKVLVEKFPDVCVLHAEVIGASSLMSSANSADCVFTLNQMFSIFDQVVDKYEVHKVDSVGFMYCSAVGFKPQDHVGRTAAGQLAALLECGKEMLRVARDMRYSETLGKLELRIGVHVGPVAAGVLGVKYPRYCFYGSTQRLSVALTQACPPMSLHVSEMVFNRIRGALGNEAEYVPYTLSSFQGLGIIRTYLMRNEWLDTSGLCSVNLLEYLAKIGSTEADSLQVMQNLVTSNPGMPIPSNIPNKPANTTQGGGMGMFAPLNAGAPAAPAGSLNMMSLATQRYEAIMAGGSGGGIAGLHSSTTRSQHLSSMSTATSAVPHTPTSLDYTTLSNVPGLAPGAPLSPTVSVGLAAAPASGLVSGMSSAIHSARASSINLPGLPVIRANSGTSQRSAVQEGTECSRSKGSKTFDGLDSDLTSRIDGEELDQVGDLPRGETEHGGGSTWGDEPDSALLRQLGLSQSTLADFRNSTATEAGRVSLCSGRLLSPMMGQLGGGSVASGTSTVVGASAAMAKLQALVQQAAVTEIATNMHAGRTVRRDASWTSHGSTGTSVSLTASGQGTMTPPAPKPSDLSRASNTTTESSLPVPVSPSLLEPQAFSISAKCLARAKQAAAAQAKTSGSSAGEAAGSAGQAEEVKAYETVEALMEALGTTYYTKALVSRGVTIADLTSMDDDGLRKAGIVTARARQQIQAELVRTKQRAAP